MNRYDNSFKDYCATKFNITKNQTEEDHFLYEADDENITAGVAQFNIKAQQYPYNHANKNAINEFPMPFLKTVDYAADKIFNGLVKSNAFEIHFPKGLTLTLKFLRILPIKAYLFLVDKLVKR